MAALKITFYKCVQDSQDYGSDDDHMVSRVFFTFEIDDKKYDLYADIRQTIGSNIEEYPIEVIRPDGYQGPFPYQCFRDAAEKYYRSLVGSSGRDINIQGGSNIRMRNNIFEQIMVVECDVSGLTAAW